MARRRKAEPVSLTAAQRERLERLWFVYGNRGPKTTPGNHRFIQGFIEHGLDLRPLQTKRTPKRDRPTAECEAAVEAFAYLRELGSLTRDIGRETWAANHHTGRPAMRG